MSIFVFLIRLTFVYLCFPYSSDFCLSLFSLFVWFLVCIISFSYCLTFFRPPYKKSKARLHPAKKFCCLYCNILLDAFSAYRKKEERPRNFLRQKRRRKVHAAAAHPYIRPKKRRFRAKRLSLKIYFTPRSFLNLWSARRENSLIICTSFAIYGRPLKRYRSCWNFVKSLSPLYSGSAISLK